MAPRIRVHLITYRRPTLLPRAVASLRAQTFGDWICELHNNDPEDGNPARLVESLGDPRFQLVQPERRTGTVEAFNLAHRPAAEPYQSILEDDNWWEPGLLAALLAALESHPEAGLAWSNMRIWQELEGGGWEDTGRRIWNLPAEGPPRIFRWPQLLQFNDAIYSNGSMLLRSGLAGLLQTPAHVPGDMFEHARERMMPFPTLLLPAPLANFSLTRQTARSTDYSAWGSTQALLGSSFLACVPIAPAAAARIWARFRAMRPPSTSSLIFAALLGRDWGFLGHATAGDWRIFVRGVLRRPWTAWRILRARHRMPDTWRWLASVTELRTAEARARGFTELGPDTLLDKQAVDPA
jgi:glycosyltransferase involved in cell wall biosynthesis